jgi:hypothetical protein
MCVTEVYIDRYPNGRQVEFRQTRLCQYGRPGMPCENLSTLENTPRKIGYGEPTSEFIIRQLNTPPRSSTSSDRPTFVDFGDESPKPKKKRRSGGLLLSTFFGDPPRRRTRRENVIVMDGPPSPRSPRSPRLPRTPPPPPPAPLPSHWNSPTLPRTPPPFVYNAAPRGRSPVIVDDRRQTDDRHHPRRASSVEVHIGRRAGERRPRSRSPSPASVLAELRRQDEQAERERRRRRDEREARLAAEIEEERERRRQEERRALHDAEINARPAVWPAVPPAPLPRRQTGMRPVVEQSESLNDILSDMNLSARGERVIAEAVAERRQRDERARMIRVGMEAEEAEAQRQRLRRRFTIGGRGSDRRHRILYDDGTYRYEWL